ncbi:hypothetical protein [Legionella jamestowniensis]|uniref:Uncharacterized protein n=1 Tax=Legionella jamestowniensis TaxID=455 RepID=A0A0W0UKM5_9GAMM|nr:hypothetical protein [Legionella jamestowniensis]KTD08440.1 hypothetical protein Ljam_2635 [Legionella jamestowniensis]OCH97093.1 hypothetical protein A8135_05530 [Legionella jamestowniensis]SFL51088.1 hypothetical protein SAMN02746073_0576 [Legionella jamestowniensis DSM 19215]
MKELIPGVFYFHDEVECIFWVTESREKNPIPLLKEIILNKNKSVTWEENETCLKISGINELYPEIVKFLRAELLRQAELDSPQRTKMNEPEHMARKFLPTSVNQVELKDRKRRKGEEEIVTIESGSSIEPKLKKGKTTKVAKNEGLNSEVTVKTRKPKKNKNGIEEKNSSFNTEEKNRLEKIEDKVTRLYNDFVSDVEKLTASMNDVKGSNSNNKEEIPEKVKEYTNNVKTLNALNKLANTFALHDEELTVLTKAFSQRQKQTGQATYPMAATYKANKPFYRSNLPGGFLFSQGGSTAGIPLKAAPVDGNYLFGRHPLYHDKDKRKDSLTDYQLLQNNKNYKAAAQLLVVLFSHMVKEYLALKGVNNLNSYALKSMICEELRRQNIDIPRQETLTAITKILAKLHLSDYLTESYIPFNNLDRRPEQQEINTENDKEEIGEDNSKVRKLWLERTVSSLPKKEKLVELPKTARKIDFNADIYDKETGRLLMSYRKKIVPSSLCSRVRATMGSITAGEMANFTRATALNDHHALDEQKVRISDKTKTRVMSVGFLGNAKSGIRMAHDFSRHRNSPVIYKLTGEIVQILEREYKAIALEEFNYCKSVVNLAEDFVIPYCELSTSADWNFDYPTSNHVDDNKFPGKHYNLLTCFYAKEEKNYSGGETYFSEYDVYFDLEEGDTLVAAFEDLLHCNAPLSFKENEEEIHDTRKYSKTSNWHRIALVAFVRGELLRLSQRSAFETSDDEVDITAQDVRKVINGTIPVKKGFSLKQFFFENYQKDFPVDEGKEEIMDTPFLNDAK